LPRRSAERRERREKSPESSQNDFNLFRDVINSFDTRYCV